MTGGDAADGTQLTGEAVDEAVEVRFTSAADGIAVHDVAFETCDFVGIAADGLRFEQCDFYDCSFENCSITGLVFERCTFSGTEFRWSKLAGVDWSGMRGSSLGHKLVFRECNLDYGFFGAMKLRETTFDRCSLREADFADADLELASLVGCDLERARFDRASLLEADLRGARNYHLDPRTTDLRRAKLSLPEALDLFDVLEITLADPDSSDL